jgi:hypothetical protein|eukprot:CAMPEP_0174375864 /NCGR_PEP_ID=MMETSP0811_2-20130205/116062_1 /TAXON_ID=73025 ORGANISM="Eutreptiella gymnastica-like, Strain CCMP1594" /NCGR_SAMPLE_ID=MMETSP0811_2 /ASSEMBLY_ACC=CAM_ASM_000667 /LENGTH=179 /DNA_ID=CAMNT_0015526493 /DNA_START=222 /DNA_END=761 /DNA_ORIENTATION=-
MIRPDVSFTQLCHVNVLLPHGMQDSSQALHGKPMHGTFGVQQHTREGANAPLVENTIDAVGRQYVPIICCFSQELAFCMGWFCSGLVDQPRCEVHLQVTFCSITLVTCHCHCHPDLFFLARLMASNARLIPRILFKGRVDSGCNAPVLNGMELTPLLSDIGTPKARGQAQGPGSAGVRK